MKLWPIGVVVMVIIAAIQFVYAAGGKVSGNDKDVTGLVDRVKALENAVQQNKNEAANALALAVQPITHDIRELQSTTVETKTDLKNLREYTVATENNKDVHIDLSDVSKKK